MSKFRLLVDWATKRRHPFDWKLWPDPFFSRFCVNVQNQPVYVRRIRPFRYEVGPIAAERTTEYVVVEPEFRRPGLRIERPHLLPSSDRRDLEGLIQRWATVHGLEIEQFLQTRTG